MTLKQELNKLKSISFDQRDETLCSIASRYTSESDRSEIQSFLDMEHEEMKRELLSCDSELKRMIKIKQQMNQLCEIVSLQYIAKNYFGKSSSWLSQRINGNKVRGRVYSLKTEDINTLNLAIRDIERKLGALTVG